MEINDNIQNIPFKHDDNVTKSSSSNPAPTSSNIKPKGILRNKNEHPVVSLGATHTSLAQTANHIAAATGADPTTASIAATITNVESKISAVAAELDPDAVLENTKANAQLHTAGEKIIKQSQTEIIQEMLKKTKKNGGISVPLELVQDELKQELFGNGNLNSTERVIAQLTGQVQQVEEEKENVSKDEAGLEKEAAQSAKVIEDMKREYYNMKKSASNEGLDKKGEEKETNDIIHQAEEKTIASLLT